MLNVIYHKSFKETGEKKCVNDETYNEMLDYIEWFASPALNPVELLDPLPLEEPEVQISENEADDEENEEDEEDEEIEEKKKRGRPKIKKE